jgi:hypothetical protein
MLVSDAAESTRLASSVKGSHRQMRCGSGSVRGCMPYRFERAPSTVSSPARSRIYGELSGRGAGREQVRQAFARVFEAFRDARFGDARHFVVGNRASQSGSSRARTPKASRVEVDGCDVFTFEGDKIARKSSYFKTRT